VGGQLEMENQPYHYRQCGLDHVYLVNGFERADTKYGDSIRVHDIDGLHRAIGMHLIEQKRPLTGAEVRFIRHELDLSQRGLGDLLDKSGQTVARWEKGEVQIDGTAERLLRLLYKNHAQPSSRTAIRKTLESLALLTLAGGNDESQVRFVEDTAGRWHQAPALA